MANLQFVGYIFSKLIKKLHLPAIKDSTFGFDSKVEASSLVVSSTFGKHTFCGYDCEIINCDVGSFCSIANRVIIGGGEHPLDWVGTSPVFYSGRDSVKTKYSSFERNPIKRTSIGCDVWIGHSALIKQGVHVGHGAVVAMGAVVTKDVAPYSIVGGNPARLIRYRFNQEIIDGLLASQWWNENPEKLHEHAVNIRNPIAFIRSMCGG
jgi:chloramphenicol O-acetyltransferase type B